MADTLLDTTPRRITLPESSHSPKGHVRNVVFLVIISINIMAIAFATNVKVANLMGKENFGQLAYGLVLGAYGAVIVRFGLDRTLVRDLHHYPDSFGELVAASLILRTFAFLLFAAALIVCKVTLPRAEALSWGVVAVAIGTALKSLDLQAVYDTWQKMPTHALYKLVQHLLYCALIWAVAILIPARLTLGWVGLATLGTVVFYLAIQNRWALKRITFRNCLSAVPSRTVLMAQKNGWIMLAATAALSFGYLNQLLLKHFRGPAELGAYAAAWQFVIVATVLLSQVARVANPLMAKITRQDTGKPQRVRFLTKYSVLMLGVSVAICFPVLLAPEFILATFFRPEYGGAAQSLRLMAVYTIIFALGVVASQYVVSARMEKAYFVSLIMGGCLSALLCILLIPKWSGLGAVLSLLAGHGSAIVLYWFAMIADIRSRTEQ